MSKIFIILITVKLVFLTPIDEWKTRLKGKCSCFENLFGTYPIEIQFQITQNLQLDKNNECISISHEVDILKLNGVEEAFINLFKDKAQLFSDKINSHTFIFYSILRLAYYAKNSSYNYEGLYITYLVNQNNLLSLLRDRNTRLTYHLNLLHRPQKFLCDNNFKISIDRAEHNIFFVKYDLLEEYSKLLKIVIADHNKIKDSMLYEDNFNLCDKLNMRNEVDNCQISCFLSKNYSQYKNSTIDNTDMFYAELKNYQGFHIEYKDYESNTRSHFCIECFFNEGIEDVRIDESNYNNIVKSLKSNFPSSYDNTHASDIEFLYYYNYIDYEHYYKKAESRLSLDQKCTEETLEHNVIYKLTQLEVFTDFIYKYAFENKAEKESFLKETEELMKMSNCSSTKDIFESAVKTVIMKGRNLGENYDTLYNFTFYKNATIFRIEEFSNRLEKAEKDIVTEALSQLREIIEINNDDDYTKTAKLLFSALLIDYFLIDFKKDDILSLSVVEDTVTIVNSVINGKYPSGSYFRYSYNGGIKSNINTKSLLGYDFDFNNYKLLIFKTRIIIYSIVLNDGTSIIVVINNHFLSFRIIKDKIQIRVVDNTSILRETVIKMDNIPNNEKSMILTGIQILKDEQYLLHTETDCEYDFTIKSLKLLNLSCFLINQLHNYKKYYLGEDLSSYE